MSESVNWRSRWCVSSRLAVAAVSLLVAAPPTTCAAGPELIAIETRTYDIFVDHKKSGQSTLQMARYGDGTEVVSTDAKLTVSWAVFTYVYEFHGQERWNLG